MRLTGRHITFQTNKGARRGKKETEKGAWQSLRPKQGGTSGFIQMYLCTYSGEHSRKHGFFADEAIFRLRQLILGQARLQIC